MDFRSTGWGERGPNPNVKGQIFQQRPNLFRSSYSDTCIYQARLASTEESQSTSLYVANYTVASTCSPHELPDCAAEQMSHLDARLEYAEESSRRLGRKDWINVFNGSVFSLILADIITQDTAQHIILTALHGIGLLFGIGGPPPHLPLG